MKTMIFFVLLSSASFGISAAAVLTIAPSKTALLPDDSSGGVRVALKFDLSDVSWGTGRQIIVANIDWPVDGLSEDAPATFTVKPITQAWDAEAVEAGTTVVQFATEPWDTWTLDALDYERLGGFLRFRVPDLVKGWLENPTTNCGVLITFENGAPANVKSLLDAAKLNIHYLVVPVDQ